MRKTFGTRSKACKSPPNASWERKKRESKPGIIINSLTGAILSRFCFSRSRSGWIKFCALSILVPHDALHSLHGTPDAAQQLQIQEKSITSALISILTYSENARAPASCNFSAPRLRRFAAKPQNSIWQTLLRRVPFPQPVTQFRPQREVQGPKAKPNTCGWNGSAAAAAALATFAFIVYLQINSLCARNQNNWPIVFGFCYFQSAAANCVGKLIQREKAECLKWNIDSVACVHSRKLQ